MKGRQGHQYLFTLMDPNTHWLEAFPMRSATSQNVARILESDIFPQDCYNVLFVSDQGKEFTANLIRNLMSMYKQQHYFGTAYHPNSNSVERAHRSLLNSIRAELSDRNWTRDKWVDCLPQSPR